MEKNDERVMSLSILSGMAIAAGYAMYFLAMESAGQIAQVRLRALNFFILLFGLLITYRAYRKRFTGQMDYLKGFGLGIFTTLVSTFLFALFLYLYMTYARPGLIRELNQTTPFFGQPLNPIMASFVVLIEGICSGVIICFILMQYYRGDISRKNR